MGYAFQFGFIISHAVEFFLQMLFVSLGCGEWHTKDAKWQ